MSSLSCCSEGVRPPIVSVSKGPWSLGSAVQVGRTVLPSLHAPVETADCPGWVLPRPTAKNCQWLTCVCFSGNSPIWEDKNSYSCEKPHAFARKDFERTIVSLFTIFEYLHLGLWWEKLSFCYCFLLLQVSVLRHIKKTFSWDVMGFALNAE